MKEAMNFIKNIHFGKEDDDAKQLLARFNESCAREVLEYHKTMPGYEPTPLQKLERLARRLGVKEISVKDESKRFGLNAFKVLGSSYALAKHFSDGDGRDFKQLRRTIPDDLTLVTATDGNHGFGVAHMAKILSCSAKINMPKGTVEHRAQRIRDLGADCIVTDLNYDDCVDKAKQIAVDG